MAPTLVGRERELIETWKRLQEGPRTACITGDPGIGKSSLLSAVARTATLDGWQVLTLRGRPVESTIPFTGVVDVLAGRGLAVTEDLRSRADELTASLLGPPDACTSGGPLALRLAVLAWLGDLAAVRPLLLVVDDQQWLDESSWSVLSFVANRLEGTGLSCLVATRSAAGAPGLEDLPVVPLAALDLESSLAVIDRLEVPLDPVVRSLVVERADGNPLALTELARTAARSPAPGERTRAVPPRVEAAFAAELPLLPARTREVLLVAASGGLDVPVLGRALASGTVAADLGPAEAVGLVSVIDGRIRFRHPLARATVYDQASSAERIEAHRRLAEAYADDPPRRTWHRAAACVGPDEAMAEELVAAAGVAHDRGAHAEAARAMVRAAELTPGKVEREARMLSAVTMMAQTGHVTRLQALAERIREESDDPAVRASAGARVAYAMAQSMRQSAALDALERSLEELLPIDPDAGWASITTLASLAYQTGRGADRVQTWYERYRNETPPTPAPYDEVTHAAQAWIETALAPMSRPAELVARVRDTPALDDRLPPDLVASQEMMLGATAWLLDEPEIATRRLEKAVAMMRRSIAPGQLIQTVMALGQVQFDRGAFAAAADSARSMIDLAEADNLTYYRLVGRELLARVRAVTGDPDAARAEAERVLRALEVGECAALEANLRVTLARVAVIGGDVAGSLRHARALFDRDGRPLHPHVSHRALGELTAIAARAGEVDAAREVVGRAGAHLVGTRNPRYTVILQRCVALLADGDEAEACFELATSNPDAPRWPFEHAQAQLEYGVWQRRQRQPTRARQQLAGALETFARIGAPAWAELAETELRAAGVASAPSGATWEQLTPQERQIVRLAAEGLTNREIGRQLYLSPRTVSTHLYRAFPKLGVASRAQLRDVVDRLDP